MKLAEFRDKYPAEYPSLWDGEIVQSDRYWCRHCMRVCFASDIEVICEDGEWDTICPYPDCQQCAEGLYWWYGAVARMLDGWSVEHEPDRVYSLPRDWVSISHQEYSGVVSRLNGLIPDCGAELVVQAGESWAATTAGAVS